VLFLGFATDAIFNRGLDPKLKSRFVGSDVYLEEICVGDMVYFGKKIRGFISLEDLLQVQEHVFSILKRLHPKFPWNEASLYLLAL